MRKCQFLTPPSESYLRWLGWKSANWWRREAHYCPIWPCKSVQYSASESRRVADFWPSNLIYDSELIFLNSCSLDQKSYQGTLITYVLSILCFLARVKFFFIANEFMLMTEPGDHNWSMYAWRMFPSRKQAFLAFETTPLLWFWFI